MASKRSLKRQIKGFDTKIEVSGVDIGNQIRLIELLGSDAVKIYKQFNYRFATDVAQGVKGRLPKKTGAFASSVRATKTKMGASFRVGYRSKQQYTRLVEFGGYNPYGNILSRAINKSRTLWKTKNKDGYFIMPKVREELPEMQKDYVRRLNKLVMQLYGKAGSKGSSRKFMGKS